MTESLAQSLVDAAAEAARAEFFATVIGFVGTVDGRQHSFMPDDIQLVFEDAQPGLWERVVRAAVHKAMVARADHLMATAADLYRVAREIREGR